MIGISSPKVDFISWALEVCILASGPWILTQKMIHFNVPIWMNIPNLLLHCWSGYAIKSIGNSLWKYIDNYDPK